MIQSLQTADLGSVPFPCPLCEQSSQRWLLQHGYWIRNCSRCGHRFAELQAAPTHTAAVYGDTYFNGGCAGYPDYLAEAALLRQQGRRYANLLKRYTSTGQLLDVGSAAGFILQGFCDSGWQGQGIEPNPTMAQYARQTLALSVEVGTLEQLEVSKTFDVVTMVQVVAHFFDVQQAFAAASQHTKSGGFWLIETWNCSSWMARLLGTHWHEYSPPSVLHWFSPDRLARFSAQYGFREVDRGRPAKFIRSSHAKSLLCYKLKALPLGPLLLKAIAHIPDHWLIPYPSEDLFWMLLQKQ